MCPSHLLLLVEAREIRADGEKLRKDLDTATKLIFKLQTEDLQELTLLKEERESNKRLIAELMAAKENLIIEHEKVSSVCKGLQQLLDNTNAVLKRLKAEYDALNTRKSENLEKRRRQEELLESQNTQLEVTLAEVQRLLAERLALSEAKQKLEDEKTLVHNEYIKLQNEIRRLNEVNMRLMDEKHKLNEEKQRNQQEFDLERRRVSQELRALQQQIHSLSTAKSAIVESLSEVNQTCNVLHHLLSKNENQSTVISAQ